MLFLSDIHIMSNLNEEFANSNKTFQHTPISETDMVCLLTLYTPHSSTNTFLLCTGSNLH